MQSDELETLAKYRVAVGFLGEKDQHDWWSSSFFSKASSAFVAPLFPRTKFLAQCKGVTAAASRLHDERIGVGQVYHLFRLPEDIEQALHRLLQESESVARVGAAVESADAALQCLGSNGTKKKDAVGPTRVGDLTKLRHCESWADAAAAYRHGFESETEVYPYFADVK